MITQEEIVSLINDVVNKIRKHKATDELPYPEFYEGYNILVREHENILIHSERGKFPFRLFKKRSPNQQDEEFNYIKDNYKQVTLPVFIDYINTIKRAFTDGNWDIRINDDDIKNYLFSELPKYNSIEKFMKEILPVIKTKDPNGCIAIKVDNFDTIRIFKDDKEVEVVDDTVKVKPTISYYNVKSKVAYKSGVYYMFLSNEKSVVEFGNSKVKEGMIFEIYDDTNIYIAKQIGRKNDYIFEINIYQTHSLGYVPVSELKGTPVYYYDRIVYNSPFSNAVDNLDLILLNSSNLQAAINNCVYPVRVMIGNECDFRDTITNSVCIGGKIFDSNTGITKECPACGGTGLKSRVSVMGTVLIRGKSRENPDGEISTDAAFKYVSPDISTLDFLIKKINEDELKARSILHIKSINNEKGENVIESINNNKAMIAFIKPISDEIFDTIEFCINTIIDMRYGDDAEKPVYIQPISFDILTDGDYLEMIKLANESGLPASVKLPLISKYINTLYSNDLDVIKIYELIIYLDKLLLMSNQDIQVAYMNKQVSLNDIVIHNSIIQIINKLIKNTEGFLFLDFDEKIKMINAEVDNIVNEIADVNEQQVSAIDRLINI